MSAIKFPPTLEVTFASVAQCEELKAAAAAHQMPPDRFLLRLFSMYQGTAALRRNNVLHSDKFNYAAPPAGLVDVPRKPMARAEAKRAILEGVRALLEEAG